MLKSVGVFLEIVLNFIVAVASRLAVILFFALLAVATIITTIVLVVVQILN